jgi:anthranilate/para-aminobenzoate synthase component I
LDFQYIKATFLFKDNFCQFYNPLWVIEFKDNSAFFYDENSQVEIENDNIFGFISEIYSSKSRAEKPYLVCFFAYSFASFFEPKIIDSREGILDFPDLFIVAFKDCQDLEKSDLINNSSDEIYSSSGFQSLISDLEYKKLIEKTKEYITDGEIYEINLSRPFLIESEKRDFNLDFFFNLYKFNPAPYAAYLSLSSELHLCSLSPECYLKKENNQISTYPIKGTRKRFADNLDLDLAQKKDLKNSIKEKAEHLMVVDIQRNDLGRICKAGSIKVKDLFTIHSLKNIYHMISEITGELKDDLDIFDILKATFPSGSITGAPKIKTMQIIRELEPFPRGFYTGSLGFIKPNGDSIFSILIRTLGISGNKILLNTGGGIVYDSEPDFEVAETYLKAQSFFNFLGINIRMSD